MDIWLNKKHQKRWLEIRKKHADRYRLEWRRKAAPISEHQIGIIDETLDIRRKKA